MLNLLLIDILLGLKGKDSRALGYYSGYEAKPHSFSVGGMVESLSNSRNTASAAWRTFLSLLEYKCKREGTHFVSVNPRGTTKEYAPCGVSTEKLLWVRQ